MDRNPKLNSEGYTDLTAYLGTKNIIKEETEMEKQVHDLVHVIKYIVNLAGFEVVGRIHFKHKKTKKEFK